MSVVAEAEELALSLSDSERANLAEKLIASLPGPFIEDDDDAIEEALRRSKEMDEDPSMSISFEDLDEMIKKRFPQCVSD
jgi:putative addiction module component (TIGR02574 family)